MPSPREHVAWLGSERTLQELQQRFPADWAIVRVRLLALEGGRPALRALLREVNAPLTRAEDRAPSMQKQVAAMAQRAMIEQTLKSFDERRESGVAEGVIRLRRWDALLLQRVLFARGLVRKPVRMLPFRLAWSLSGQPRRLMPLVRRRGICCFYSAALIRRLARTIGTRSALEIGAGDGTLTAFLRSVGADVVATDDHSWAKVIDYPEWVERANARMALRRHAPQVVLCSWPPPGNAFEQEVFQTDSVQTYIVITSADPAEASNWSTYAEQANFHQVPARNLSRLVLPYRRNTVLLFHRSSTES